MRDATEEKLAICDMSPAADVRSLAVANDLYQFCYEKESGIIRTIVRGFWSIEDADAYFERLRLYIDAGRRRFGIVRVLVDRRSSPVQSSDVAMRMQAANETLFSPTDRLAIVVGSSLLQMQLRHLFRHEGSGVFLSHDAAVAWLQSSISGSGAA